MHRQSPGADGKDIYNFTNIDHAQRLISKAKEIKKAVVIGGGLIGLKAAESLHDRGVEVTILELSPRILSLAFDGNAARLAAKRLDEVGLHVRTGTTVKEVLRNESGSVVAVQCTDGMIFETDAVISAIGVHAEYLKAGCGIEIKVGQGAKPGIGGHLPGEKINDMVSETRMVPIGSDAISPAPHHDIYSIEDLLQLIFALKEASEYKVPVAVKIAAVHNVAAIASGIARAGADIITIDGMRGGTGAAPAMIRDNVGIPIELALAAVDQRLRDEGIRHKASIIAAGGIRCAADVFKAIALGADAVYIGTATLMSVGCTLCGRCYTGKCPWGIATNSSKLSKRQNPEIAAQRMVNLVKAWSHEIQEMLGGMGLNSIESVRGNRDKLRAVGLSDTGNGYSWCETRRKIGDSR